MKLGVITDIHNNVIALEAILAKFKDLNIDGIICCGDIIGIGPRPEETVTTMMNLDNLIACVRGNHERYYLESMPTTVPNDEHMDWDEMEHHKWEHHLLNKDNTSFLERLPYSQLLEICGIRIYVSHYCLNSDNKYVNYTPNPTSEDLDKMFSNIDADLILYGHNHTCSIVNSNNKWYVNCGSLGCPSKDKNVASAGIVAINSGVVDIKHLQIKYDVNTVVADIEAQKYPDYDAILKYFYGIE